MSSYMRRDEVEEGGGENIMEGVYRKRRKKEEAGSKRTGGGEIADRGPYRNPGRIHPTNLLELWSRAPCDQLQGKHKQVQTIITKNGALI